MNRYAINFHSGTQASFAIAFLECQRQTSFVPKNIPFRVSDQSGKDEDGGSATGTETNALPIPFAIPNTLAERTQRND
jgi:hypothetical protein